MSITRFLPPLKLADFKEPDGQRFGILEKVKRTLFFRI